MKKGLLILILLLALTCSVVFTACDNLYKWLDPNTDCATNGHTLDEAVIVAATCTIDGTDSKTCKNCDHVEVVALPALGHDFGEFTSEIEATCKNEGSKIRNCSRCEVVESDVFEQLPHDLESVIVDATCTMDGTNSQTCTVCDHVDEVTALPALGHDFGEFTTEIEATCQNEGSKIRNCSRCEVVESDVLEQLPHDLTTIGTASTQCTMCDTANVAAVDISTLEYQSDINYTVMFDETTSITELSTLAGKSVKSMKVVLFKNGAYTLPATMTFAKNITIDGNGSTITNGFAKAFIVTGTDFTLTNITVDSTVAARAITIATTDANNVTIDNVKLKFAEKKVSRGITYDNTCEDSSLTVRNSEFLIGDAAFHEVDANYNDSRGISLWNTKNATINITNTKIKGFSYSVNLSGDSVSGVRDSSGCKLLIDGCDVSGWNFLNIWSSGTEIIVKDTTVKGINNLTTEYNSFSVIVINQDIYNLSDGVGADAINLTIDNCKFSNYQNEVALAADQTENFIRLDLIGTSKISITDSTFTDTTGKNIGVFYFTGADGGPMAGDEAKVAEVAKYFEDNIIYTNVTATTIDADGVTIELPCYTILPIIESTEI